MAREGLMDDSGCDFFDVSDCTNYESCREDAFNDGYAKGRADGIEECIKLFKEMQPRLATNVVEFGDMLEQLKGE